ncbi:bifunctional transcriptional activator/DNA repair enzyme AdaA [Oxobacter pfennigii]|uniref:Bifunctional transcriptional activator/DNA repair enzyme AdaA n=1 Tax=Oxobacter pfennigii TaxID=36849 RepID=A0A0P8W624_9CLOT|nr:helix-turn-helix domain-containing protein [Oxobacter pfennigii]KPU43154.1 bifunctional transcriptional activator/DNA repair enzyme AdaA [Oxobacter pfennigii]
MSKSLRPESYHANQKMATHKMTGQAFELFYLRDRAFKGSSFNTNYYHAITFCTAGEVSVIVDDKRHILKAGEIFLTKASCKGHYMVLEPTPIYERVLLWIKPGFISTIEEDGINLLECFDTVVLRPNSHLRETIMDIVLKLEKTCIEQAHGHEILSYAYIVELLIYLNRAYKNIIHDEIEVDIKYSMNIDKVIEYIDENLCCDLSLDKLADKFYISKYWLLREFKKSVGFTLYNYILQKRLSMAKQLIMENVSVTEVYLKCGFRDYTNFIAAFKKAYGLPPKKYYKKYINSFNKRHFGMEVKDLV